MAPLAAHADAAAGNGELGPRDSLPEILLAKMVSAETETANVGARQQNNRHRCDHASHRIWIHFEARRTGQPLLVIRRQKLEESSHA